MKFFDATQGAIDYIIPELIATLQDDINDQTRNGVPALEIDGELEEKIADITEVQKIVEAAPELLEACHKAYCKLVELEVDADHTLYVSEELKTLEDAINKAEGR